MSAATVAELSSYDMRRKASLGMLRLKVKREFTSQKFYMVLCAFTQNQFCFFAVSMLLAAATLPNVFGCHEFLKPSFSQTHVLILRWVSWLEGFTGHVKISLSPSCCSKVAAT